MIGIKATPIPGAVDVYEYYLDFNEHRFHIMMDFDLFTNEKFWNSNREKIKSLLYNGIWLTHGFRRETVENFIEHNYPIKLPSQKLDDLLEYFHSLTHYEGEATTFPKDLIAGELWRKFFFTNGAEAEFYVRALQKQDLISLEDTKDGIHQFSITIDGLNRIVKLSESKNSRFCFVAMSFAEEMEEVYSDAIASAIRESGFEPIRIKDESIPSDVTINDAILAAIKRSKFTIADFTSNRNGVYFEAGYALGLGQKVIYTCRNSDFDVIHFDTNHYQYIVWGNLAELKKGLIDKIEVFIKS